MSYGAKVAEFQSQIAQYPVPSELLRELPANWAPSLQAMINEELDETLLAAETNDMVEVADGLADLLYFIVGQAVRVGIDIDAVFDEVHRSNMTKKSGPKPGRPVALPYDCYKDADYSAPDLATVLGGSNAS